MQQFLTGIASGTSPRELVNTCLSQVGDIPAEATLGFIYTTDALSRELEHIHQLLKQATGISHWIGTIGVAICATDQEIYDQPAMAVMIADIPRDQFRIIPTLTSSVDEFQAENKAWLERLDHSFGIVHADPSNPAAPTLIDLLADSIPNSFFVGGLTSSQSHHYQLADTISLNGISGALFAPETEVLVDHTQGCSPIGPVRHIEQCHRNIIGSIDGMTAVEALKKDVGEVLARDLNRVAGYVFAGLPIQQSDTGDYLVRNLVGIDANQGLVAIGELVESGDPIMFCRRDGNTAVADMKAMLERLSKRCGGRTPRGGLYVSCLGRGRNQFGDESEELKLISETLGKFPLVGFFANGELYHNRLYGYTGVLTLFL
ncbi:MAG: FIST signal transduction protein [Thiotrichales bacterium]